MPLAAGQRLAHYRLLEVVGEGGMGVVWRGLDVTLEREVAIKILPPSLMADRAHLERFEREARLLAALDHPNIVTIHSVEQAEGVRFFTMELVRGRRLADLIPAQGMAYADLLAVAVPLARAVAAAHERGLVHGDLKPANVMVTGDGRVKVLDFGLARRDTPAPPGSAVDPGTLAAAAASGSAGTLPYMAPERFQGRPHDARSDLFALGVMLYEMTTGRRPFDARDAYVLAASVLNDQPPLLGAQRPDLPVHLGWVIERCLAKDPAQRLPSAGRLAEELEALRSAGLVAAEGERSIAVLPFTDLSPERDQEHFCEGVAEVIINALARVPGLRVASRTASFQFRGGVMSPRRIGQRLGARSLLEGSVLKAGDRLRVTATLTGIEDGYCLWSERFEGRLADIFEIQDRIARRIVAALGAGPAPRADRALARPGTRDAEAYDWYLRGRRFIHQQNRRGIELARQMFARALELDPGYALGHAGMADCWAYVFNFLDRDPAHLDRALEAANRAVELDPALVQAHVSRAFALAIRDQQDEAEREYARALELGPEVFEAHYLFARQCFMRGRTAEAVRHYEEAMRLRPEDYQSPLLVAQIYADLGRTADAEAMRRRGVNLAEERLRHEPDDIRAMYMAANGMVALGETERGLEWVARALALEPDDTMLLYNSACIYSLAGRLELALDCLEHEERVGNIQLSWMEHDSNLDRLRTEPRFQRLMERKRAAQPA